MTIEHHPRPAGLPPANGYSHVTVATGRLVHVSGQVPLRADGSIVPGGAGEQADQVFQNLGTALRSAGASWADVVKLTYYLTDIGDLDVVRAVRDRYVDPHHLPASSFQVAALIHPQFRVENDAVAVVDG